MRDGNASLRRCTTTVRPSYPFPIRSILTPAPQIRFTHGNAQALPKHIEDNSIDLYTIAFGIRNCTSLPSVLSEAYRVLKPGGKIGVLEFGKVSNPLFRE